MNLVTHLISSTLLEDKFCLKKNLSITYKPITLLVGDQGCGKSTLLELLQKHDPKKIKLVLSDTVFKDGIKTYYFDTEKMNPRVNNLDSYTNPNGTNRGIGIGAAIASHFQSHGEILREFTVNRIGETKDCVLYLDEPESALSLKNQYKLSFEINEAIKRNVQLIIATHCLPLIESVKEVYSLEHLKWMKSETFIKYNNTQWKQEK